MMQRILQQLNDRGISIPIFFKNTQGCQQIWKSQTNESPIGNRPTDFAEKSTEIVDVMEHLWSMYLYHNNVVMELGCNCGANLHRLQTVGYTNLSGIEINTHTIDELKIRYPNLNAKIYYNSIENVLPGMKHDSIDMIFSMSVLMHIPPKSNHVFKMLVDITDKWICTVEDENTGCHYVFSHNYKKIFERLRMTQVAYLAVTPDVFKQPHEHDYYPDYKIRIFKKRRHM